METRKGIRRSESKQKTRITLKLHNGEVYGIVFSFLSYIKSLWNPLRMYCDALKLSIAGRLLGNRVESNFQNQEKELYGRKLSARSWGFGQKYITNLQSNLAGGHQRNKCSALLSSFNLLLPPICQMQSRARDQARIWDNSYTSVFLNTKWSGKEQRMDLEGQVGTIHLFCFSIHFCHSSGEKCVSPTQGILRISPTTILLQNDDNVVIYPPKNKNSNPYKHSIQKRLGGMGEKRG